MRFGIISTADIARTALIPAVQKSEHTVAAIASRDESRARDVADDLGIPHAYGSYEALLASEEIDAVYNPLPNGLHGEWTKRAADAGLDVLSEKPLTADADEAEEVVEHCREAGVTLMEGFMYRYHPRTERAAELVSEELEGVHSVNASFKFRLDWEEDVRLDPDLAGGALMDVGCYAVSAARLFLGEPDRVYAHQRDSRESGVDTDLMGILEYGDAMAHVDGSFDAPEVQRYRVEAENGWVEAQPAFNVDADAPATLEYEIDGERGSEEFEPVDQYRAEVDAFAECVERGDEPRTGGDEAIANMRVIDALYESAERGVPVDVE
ncbi:Gfo/Idh/MocA family protein [Halobellus sp. EA9]|uniref:Gfo/Idh/MocA family protein n=1 Tax=Halobellus sp. EA9 TaxID=3421647 RepID=UPI003EBADC68